MKYVASALAAIGLSFAVAAPLHAQNVNANNLVNVQVDADLLQNIANNLDIVIDIEDVNVPVTVQAPIGVAANVCNIDANVLAEQAKSGTAECDAENTSQAFNQIVKRQFS